MFRLNKKFAVSYCSIDINTKNGYSIEELQQECLDYAKKCGLDIVIMYADELSEANSTRRALHDMQAFCCNSENEIKYVIINRNEGLYSSIDDFVKLAIKLDSCGINILSVDNTHLRCYDDNMTQNMQWVLGLKKDMQSAKIRLGMEIALCGQGRWIWRAPFGYKEDRKKRNIVPDNANSKIVKSIFTNVARGLSYSELLLYLKCDLDIHIQPKALIKILTNPIYCGYIYKPEWSDELIKGTFKPIINAQLFYKVQHIIESTEWQCN